MSEEIRLRVKGGEQLPASSKKIPMVDLPLGATEDRVCGTIDIEKALTEGGYRSHFANANAEGLCVGLGDVIWKA